MNESEYQKQLYIALWYLCSDTDYTETTRCEMVESIIEGLSKHGLLSGDLHERGLNMVEQEYDGHPFQDRVMKYLRGLSRPER
jgi:hypothetical protein